MNHPAGPTDSPSPPGLGAIARTTIGPDSVITKPVLSSGFGVLMRKERDLQSATEDCLGIDRGPHSAAIDRILHEQYARLGANIAILEQRYETIPPGSRIGGFQTLPQPPLLTSGRSVEWAANGWLLDLVGQHEGLMASVDRLVAEGSDGQRGALILAEVAQNHEEMVWMLTTLLRDGLAMCDVVSVAAVVRTAPATTG